MLPITTQWILKSIDQTRHRRTKPAKKIQPKYKGNMATNSTHKGPTKLRLSHTIRPSAIQDTIAPKRPTRSLHLWPKRQFK